MCLKKKIFSKDFLVKECDDDLSIALFSHVKHELISEKQFLEDVFDRNNNGWIVRIVISDMKNKKKRHFIDNIANFFSKYGLVHLAIQIGPYLMDWMKNSEVRIRSICSSTSMVFLYPHPNSNFNPNDMEIKRKITNYIFDFRKKEYNLNSCNCQHFVDNFLNILNIDKNWTRNSYKPIRSFLKEIKNQKVKLEEYQLSFFGVNAVITSHEDLKYYWLALLPHLKDEINLILVAEIVELVKGLERGYFARRDTGGSGPIDFGEYLNPDGTVKNSDMISVLCNRVNGNF